MIVRTFLIASLVVALALVRGGHAHGYLKTPLTRGSLWRDPRFAIYNPPENSNDRGLNCGTYAGQHWINGGLCGPCGDDWRFPVPRLHENTGEMSLGIVVETYTAGQVIEVELFIEAEHQGYSHFRICELSTPSTVETNECFGEFLQLSDGSGTRLPIQRTGMFNFGLRLPVGVTCVRCVIQWEYVTGNDYGECEDGTSGLGCGPQETFRNCADIAIL